MPVLRVWTLPPRLWGAEKNFESGGLYNCDVLGRQMGEQMNRQGEQPAVFRTVLGKGAEA